MTAWHNPAPSDSTLAYLRSLCEDRGIDPLPVVGSQADASRCIDAIKAREFDPDEYSFD